MRKTLLILIGTLMCVCLAGLAKKPVEVAPSYAWKIMPPLGLHEEADIDTNFIDYSRQSVPSAVSDAWATTGNYGAEGREMIWYKRPAMSDFFFRDALSAWLPSLETQKFYNTRIPMTLLSYNTAGGKETTQDRLKGIFSGNINSKAQVGALLDYIYSKGCYQNQADKNLIWGLNGSYMGDRFEFQGFYNHWNGLNKENGGIEDDRYITDPEEVQGGVSSVNPQTIPVLLTSATNRLSGAQLYLNARYKVGHWHEEQVDTTVVRTYIPVSSFIWTMEYNRGRHVFRNDAAGEAHKLWENMYLTPDHTYDKTTYWSLRNTVGVSLLEGWHKLFPFGVAAYATHEIRRYNQTADTLSHEGTGLTPLPDFAPEIANSVTQNLLYVGGQITKQRGSILTYGATAKIGIVGPAAGDLHIDGNIRTRFPLLGDSVSITAMARFTNEHAPFLMNNYRSNHFMWHNNFGKERRLNIGGSLNLRRTDTRLDIFVENVQNHIYFGPDFMPAQHGGSVQVLTARLQQNLSWRALHWDNTLTFQKSADESVIPLPKFVVYSNLYAIFRIATLRIQLGIDCDWYTKYYAPNYQPATMSFAVQREVKIGNYPFMNLYANMHLGKVRFYVMMSHINQGIIGGNNWFSMPHYPLNPRRFQIGLSVDFAN